MQQESLPRVSSGDPDNRALLENAHPSSWQNPQPVDYYNLAIVGGGPAGLLTAYLAAALGAKVALIERDLLGGQCFNVGCVPSKAIIRTSRLYAEMRAAENFGAQVPSGINVDFQAAMERCGACVRASVGVGVRHSDSVRWASTCILATRALPDQRRSWWTERPYA